MRVLSRTALGFYRKALRLLQKNKLPYLVGGAYALRSYTGVTRHTKDMDLFIQPQDCPRALQILSKAGYETEWTSPQWLGKAVHGHFLVDFILGFANGIGQVDASWFQRAVPGVLFGIPVQLVAPEEMIWMKAFVQARDRFDGADVAHLLRACSKRMDWRWLLTRFAEHGRVLFSHLILFGFIYPGERHRIPSWVMKELMRRLKKERRSPSKRRICMGPLFSHMDYRIDLQRWGYSDPRAKRDRHNLEAKSSLRI